MFAIPGQNAVKLTNTAVSQINKLMDSKKYFGLGKSKKLAEQNAASKLVKSLKI